jgi:hypothetical protein
MPGRKVIVSLLNEAQVYQRHQAADAREAGARRGLEIELLWSGNDPGVQLRVIAAGRGRADGGAGRGRHRDPR